MGGGRIAIRASQYMPDNIHIKIIETDREKCVQISEKVPKNVLIIHGDGRDTDLLRQEGILNTQAFIALTENSSPRRCPARGWCWPWRTRRCNRPRRRRGCR